MARYEHLPIYKKAMDLAVHMEQTVRNFSRYHKYTLGSELREKSREVVEAIIRGKSRVEKLPHLIELREKLEGLHVLLRIAKEVRALASFKSYAWACGQCLQWGAMRDGRSWPVSDVHRIDSNDR